MNAPPLALDNFIYKLMKDITEARLMGPDNTVEGHHAAPGGEGVGGPTLSYLLSVCAMYNIYYTYTAGI